MPFLLAGAKGGKSCCCFFFYILGSTYYGQHKLLLLTTVNNFLCIDWVVFIHIHKKKKAIHLKFSEIHNIPIADKNVHIKFFGFKII